jgi:hypothetical protein
MGGRLITRVAERCLGPVAERVSEVTGIVLLVDGVREGLGEN